MSDEVVTADGEVNEKGFMSFVVNSVSSTMAFFSSRLQRMTQSLDPRRNIEYECGHPQLYEEVNAETYHVTFETNPIAGRVVEVFPQQSWQVQPDVYEDENPKVDTPFEKAWRELGKNLEQVPSFLEGPKGGPIWSVLKRADIMSGVGRYGVILLGLDDIKEGGDKNLSNEVEPGEATKLTFLRVFGERHAKITAWESDVTSARYGLPIKYQITFTNPGAPGGSANETNASDVHWSRVVHIADNIQESEVLGLPRMKPVWNNILDLKKLYGGSAEMYWKGAFPGFSIEALPEFVKAKIDTKAMQSEIEKFMNGLSRYFSLIGATVKSLAPQVVDPTPQIEAQLTAICIKLNIPKRVFMGSERGELSSGQDDASWNDILRERQLNYLTPSVIARFINHLIYLQVLPTPTKYFVSWPDLTSQTPQEKASVAFRLSQALAQYANSKAREVIAPTMFFTDFLGFNEQRAIAFGSDKDRVKGAQDGEPGMDAGKNNPNLASGHQAKNGSKGNNGQLPNNIPQAQQDPQGNK